MKTRSKALLTVLCAMLLVVVSVCGTLAYLTDKDEAKNTFTVGKVDIELDEAKVNDDGKPVDDTGEVVDSPDEAKRVTENTYHLLPGHEYTKDPTITVKAGSDASYVRALVSVSKASATDDLIKELVNGEHISNISDVLVGLCYVTESNNADQSNPWILAGNTVENNIRTYEFRYYQTVSAVKNKENDDGTMSDADVVLPELFDKILIPGAVNNTQISTLEGLEIKVVANAIQADGFSTADLAWKAFENQTKLQTTTP